MAGTKQGRTQGGEHAADLEIRWDVVAMKALLEGEDGPVAKQLARTAIRVMNEAKRLCPVDTGRLRASITHVVRKDSTGLHARVGTDVDYAEIVEFGGSNQAPQGFLRPALFSVIGKIQR